MADDSQTRKNCLQWGLRILTPKAYFALLRRFAVKLSPDAYEQIKKAHMGKRGGAWWYQWLTCQIVKEKKWINIGTGARIADWHWDKIATFLSWESYEDFREEMRGEVSKRLRDNPL